MNDITLNKKIYKYLGEQTSVHRDRAYTTEEMLQELYQILFSHFTGEIESIKLFFF